MKTINKNAQEKISKTKFIEMSNEELKSFQGGVNVTIVRNPDGSVDIIFGTK